MSVDMRRAEQEWEEDREDEGERQHLATLRPLQQGDNGEDEEARDPHRSIHWAKSRVDMGSRARPNMAN
eukprot:3941363-Pyramimonas_sp.AAC.1